MVAAGRLARKSAITFGIAVASLRHGISTAIVTCRENSADPSDSAIDNGLMARPVNDSTCLLCGYCHICVVMKKGFSSKSRMAHARGMHVPVDSATEYRFGSWQISAPPGCDCM